MEDLFYMIFGSLKDYESLSPDMLPLTALFALVGGLILSKFTGSIGSLTLPINCSAMFLGAMGSNWLLQNLKLPVEGTIEAPLMISMMGMTAASACMMWWLQGDSMRG
jgi:uncharacterized membrane protein YhhN